jgi:hypothetical protein
MEEGRRENGVIGTKYQDKKERRYKKRNSKHKTQNPKPETKYPNYPINTNH